jgi:hypothetical protein
MDIEKRVSLKIDLSAGTIELDAPAESFDQAIERTKELTATLDLGGRRAQVPQGVGEAEPPAATASAENTQGSHPPRLKGRTGKVATPSASRPGRIGSFEEVRGLLTEEQEIELRSFMAEKAPSEQADQVLVAMVKGEQLLGRRGFGFNEIYTLVWLSGVKDLPKALDVVLLRLAQEQKVVREPGGFAVKFVGRNRVERDLPRSAKEG